MSQHLRLCARRSPQHLTLLCWLVGRGRAAGCTNPPCPRWYVSPRPVTRVGHAEDAATEQKPASLQRITPLQGLCSVALKIMRQTNAEGTCKLRTAARGAFTVQVRSSECPEVWLCLLSSFLAFENIPGRHLKGVSAKERMNPQPTIIVIIKLFPL